MSTGIIKRYDYRKGFGFITEEQSGEDFFFHKSEWDANQPIKPGIPVLFDAKDSDKGPQAENVSPVNPEPVSDEKKAEKPATKSQEKPASARKGGKRGGELDARIERLESAVARGKLMNIVTLLVVAAFVVYSFVQ